MISSLQHLEIWRLTRSQARRGQPLSVISPSSVATARETGTVQPLIARPMDGAAGGRHEILMGERQWLVAQRAGLETVPVWIRDDLDEEEVTVMLAGESVADSRPNPITEARTIRAMIQAEGLSIAGAARRLGRTRTDVSHQLRLLRLPPAVQQMVANGRLSAGQVRPLITLNRRTQLALAQEIATLGLSARAVEERIRQQRGTNSQSRDSAADPHLDPNLRHLEGQLANLVGCPVHLRYDISGRGRLSIDFSDLDVMDGVLERLGYRAGL